MKKFIAQFAAVLLLLTAAVRQNAQAQSATNWIPGKYMTQSVANVLSSALRAGDITSFGFRDGTCVMSAYIRRGNTVTMPLRLESGESYLFIAGGDDDATDVDLSVENANGLEVASDKKVDNKPFVLYTPPVSGNYTVKVRLYAGKSAGSFCTLALMEQGANRVPAMNLAKATAKIIAMGTLLDQRHGVKFHDLHDEWCLYGAVLGSNESTAIAGLKMGSEKHYFVGGGDTNLEDADLSLFGNKYASDPLCSDTESDPNPMFGCNTNSYDRYKLKILNARSSGKSLVMAAVLTD